MAKKDIFFGSLRYRLTKLAKQLKILKYQVL